MPPLMFIYRIRRVIALYVAAEAVYKFLRRRQNRRHI